jgi:DNA-3-methyladenine glycosylase II
MPREPYSQPEGALIFFAHGTEGRALSELDDELGALIQEVGEVHLETDGDGFLSLARAIVDQQISIAAARSIWNRYETLCGGRVTPEATLHYTEEDLRSCGLSRSKVLSLKDLSQHVTDGRIDFAHMEALDDEAIIEELTKVRGIGRWTAQMFLIFSLGRPDVFALDDGGLRRAVAKLKGLDPDVPKPLIEALSEDWTPYRTAASLFLWAALNNTPKD